MLVVDNDPRGSGRSAVPDLDSVSYVIEQTPGIAAARNRALDESVAERLLVFIDDDEVPQPNWLAALLDTWASTQASAVMGRVVSIFPTPPTDPWVLAGGFFTRPSRVTGTRIDVAATGNLLLDLDAVRDLGVRFDGTLGLAGGEDNLFSRQLVSRGGTIVWCEESVAEDEVSADRLTRAWRLKRSVSHGNASVATSIILAPTPTRRALVRVQASAGGLARVLVGSLSHVVGRLRKDIVMDATGASMAHRGWGMLAAAGGRRVEEYARDTEPDRRG
jgi:hypothetical protein